MVEKKRRIDEEGNFKKVLQMKKSERKEEEEPENHENCKKSRIEPRKVFLGGIIKDAELEEVIDWEKRREEILQDREKEKKDRLERIAKARKLEKVWELSRECSRFLKENTTTWIDHNHAMEHRKKEEQKLEQKERAKAAKQKFLEDHTRKTRMRSIQEMLRRIPKNEAERIEDEVKSAERRELAEMKKNIWRKWRGKNKVIENKTK